MSSAQAGSQRSPACIQAARRFFRQVSEQSFFTCSASHAPARVLPGGDTAVRRSCHRRRRATGSTSPPGRRARAGEVPRTSTWTGVLMTVDFPPLRPIRSYLGLPTQVQDLFTLLLDVVISICQSCFRLDSTVSPVLDLCLIVPWLRGLRHPAWRWCWRLTRSHICTACTWRRDLRS